MNQKHVFDNDVDISGLTVEQAIAVLEAIALPTELEIEKRREKELEKAKRAHAPVILIGI